MVEDEKRLAENVARALRESAGYAVDIAGDGEEGLYLAESTAYDLMVLDLMLPKMDGPTLLTHYRKKGHATPVLVLTARDEKDNVVRLLNAGPTITFPSPSIWANFWRERRRWYGEEKDNDRRCSR